MIKINRSKESILYLNEDRYMGVLAINNTRVDRNIGFNLYVMKRVLYICAYYLR